MSPPKPAAIINQRHTQVLQKGFVVSGEWEEGRGTFAAWPAFQIHVSQSKHSPSKAPTLATRG